jgi:3-dehydroquinate dehydratase
LAGIKRDIMLNEAIHEVDVTALNVHASNANQNTSGRTQSRMQNR